MRHLLNEQEAMDGKKIRILMNVCCLFFSSRMTISEFKNSYAEMSPNANMFNLDNDAERRIFKYDFLFSVRIGF
jgi:hypothetical protein